MVTVIMSLTSRISQHIELQEVTYWWFISMITQAWSDVKCLSGHTSILNLLLVIPLLLLCLWQTACLYCTWFVISNISQSLDLDLLQFYLHFQYNSSRCRRPTSRSDARCVEDVNPFVQTASATVILYDLCICPAGTLCDRTGPGLFQHDLTYRASPS